MRQNILILWIRNHVKIEILFVLPDSPVLIPVCDHEVGVSDFAPDQFQASSSVDVDHDADKARLRKPTAWVARFVSLYNKGNFYSCMGNFSNVRGSPVIVNNSRHEPVLKAFWFFIFHIIYISIVEIIFDKSQNDAGLKYPSMITLIFDSAFIQSKPL